MFLKAARHAELDLLTGVSSNIMCGQSGYYGTSSFQVMLNIDEVNKLEAASLDKKIEIDKLLQVENPKMYVLNKILLLIALHLILILTTQVILMMIMIWDFNIINFLQ